MKTIKLMPGYGCFPLWKASPDAVGSIDPETLPISADLKSRLNVRALRYDNTLDPEEPGGSGSAAKGEDANFVMEGEALASILRAVLGQEYSVITDFSSKVPV